MTRPSIPKDVKDYVWERDGAKCVECGSMENLEFDHIIPQSRGGSNDPENVQILCVTCNRKKGASVGLKPRIPFWEKRDRAEFRLERLKAKLAQSKKRLEEIEKSAEERTESLEASIRKAEEALSGTTEAIRLLRKKRDIAKARWDKAREEKAAIRSEVSSSHRKRQLVMMQEKLDRTRRRFDKAESQLVRMRERQARRDQSLEAKRADLQYIQTKSCERIERLQTQIEYIEEQVRRARERKRELESRLG